MLPKMIDLATVRQETTSGNAFGGVARSFSNRIVDEPCRLSNSSMTETDANGKKSIISVWILYFDYSVANAAIATSDLITVSGKNLQVKTVYCPCNHHVEVTCLEVK